MTYLKVLTTPARVKTPFNISTLQPTSTLKENMMKRMHSLYKSLLVLSLAAVLPSAALAVEPVIDGIKTATDATIISSTGWRHLLIRQVVIPAGSVFNCAVTCSSDVNVPLDSNSANLYQYAAFNSANLVYTDACVRSFSTPRYDGIPQNFVSRMALSSTCYVPNLSGTQNFYCLGKNGALGI
jgi:hypothetical protein